MIYDTYARDFPRTEGEGTCESLKKSAVGVARWGGAWVATVGSRIDTKTRLRCVTDGDANSGDADGWCRTLTDGDGRR